MRRDRVGDTEGKRSLDTGWDSGRGRYRREGKCRYRIDLGRERGGETEIMEGAMPRGNGMGGIKRKGARYRSSGSGRYRGEGGEIQKAMEGRYRR